MQGKTEGFIKLCQQNPDSLYRKVKDKLVDTTETTEILQRWFTSIFYKLSNPFHKWCIEVFSKWRRTFIEFTELREFRESEKSLRHELGSV